MLIIPAMQNKERELIELIIRLLRSIGVSQDSELARLALSEEQKFLQRLRGLEGDFNTERKNSV